MATRKPVMNHQQRLDLIYKGLPPVRVCHSIKRWAGVFVVDTFGEFSSQYRLAHRRSGGIGMGTITKYDASEYDALAEAILGNAVLEEVGG